MSTSGVVSTDEDDGNEQQQQQQKDVVAASSSDTCTRKELIELLISEVLTTTTTTTTNDTETDDDKNNNVSNSNNSNSTHDIEYTFNSYELERHGRGESYHPTMKPDIIILPKTIKDIQRIVQFCYKHTLPIIPFGAGTSVEGHICALYGGISLDMKYLNHIQIPDTTRMSSAEQEEEEEEEQESYYPDPIAVVGAGVTRHELNDALRHTGYQFTVDPGANATLGGMVSTCASGTTTVRYGTIRDNLLCMTCILPDEHATVVQLGTKASKNSAGYDLLSLMCGSEGTLGIICSVTVKLHPIPEHCIAAVCQFNRIHQATNAVHGLLMGAELPLLTRCELLDAASVRAYNMYNNNNHNSGDKNNDNKNKKKIMDERPTLFLEFQGSSQVSMDDHIEQAKQICFDANANDAADIANDDNDNDDIIIDASTSSSSSSFEIASSESDRRSLWAARHELYYAAIASARFQFNDDDNSGSTTTTTTTTTGGSSAIVTDACVPQSQFAKLMEDTVRHVAELKITGPCFGHAGDGNLHCILPIPDHDVNKRDDNTDSTDSLSSSSSSYMSRVQAVHDKLIERTIEAGGTCTGEHGIGYGKMKHLHKQYGNGTVHMMKMIKKSIDMKNIMNPGKVVDI